MSKKKKFRPQVPQNQNREMVTRQAQLYSGPLPPPAALEHYERVLPGAAERIITAFEKQSEHRRTLEAKVTTSDVTNSKRGQIFGFIIGFSGVGLGGIAVIMGRPTAGTILGGVSLACLVGVFIYGSASRRKERGNIREDQMRRMTAQAE